MVTLSIPRVSPRAAQVVVVVLLAYTMYACGFIVGRVVTGAIRAGVWTYATVRIGWADGRQGNEFAK